jgi:2-oxoglutarate dehydrogenase E1 component
MPNPLLTSPDALQLAQRYERYLREPSALAPEWQAFFGKLDAGARGLLDALRRGEEPERAPARPAPAVPETDARSAARDSIRALALINAFRTRGHLEARLDPLGMRPIEPQP